MIAPEGTLQRLNKRGQKLLKVERYEDAMKEFKGAILLIAGHGCAIPQDAKNGGGMWCEHYPRMGFLPVIKLMALCNDVASCLVGLGQDEEALDWLDEIQIIIRHLHWMTPHLHWDWQGSFPRVEEYFRQRLIMFNQASDVYLRLGNAGAAVHRKWNMRTTLSSLPQGINRQDLDTLLPALAIWDISKFRHPDPKLSVKLLPRDDSLQVRGSWQKVEVPRTARIQSRMGFASFVWRSRYYPWRGKES